MPKKLDLRWEAIIMHVMADHPEYGGGRLTDRVQELGKAQGIEQEAPVQRTIEARLRSSKIDKELQQSLASLRRVRFPHSFGTPDLPWEAAGPVMDFMVIFEDIQRGPEDERFGVLMNEEPRPTTRAAKWYWRLYLAAPTAPPELLGLMACKQAFAEVTRQEKFKYLYQCEVEDWLLFGPWQQIDPATGELESDETWKERSDSFQQSVAARREKANRPKRTYPDNDYPPTPLELVELGIRQDQWEKYQSDALMKSSTPKKRRENLSARSNEPEDLKNDVYARYPRQTEVEEGSNAKEK